MSKKHDTKKSLLEEREALLTALSWLQNEYGCYCTEINDLSRVDEIGLASMNNKKPKHTDVCKNVMKILFPSKKKRK